MTNVLEFSDFQSVDHQIWLEKIKLELKSKSLSELNYLWDEVMISPVNLLAADARIVSNRQNNSWKIGSYIKCSGPQANAELLTALNEGASSIYIEVDKSVRWNELLNEVHLEWIHSNFKFHFKKDLTNFIQYLKETKQSPPGSISLIGADPIKFYKEFNSLLPGYRLFNFELIDIQHRNELAQIFHQISKLIENLSKQFNYKELLHQVVIHIYGQNDLILHVSMIRAIRLLWRELLAAAGLNKDEFEIYVVGHVKKETGNSNEYIRSGLVALSFILGGIDELFIETDSNEEGSRYSRMIQHIFDQEAYLSKNPDPLAGSAVIECLTGWIVEKVWNESILLDQQKK